MTAVDPRVVILAAGASTRLGEPKALVDLGGRCALRRLVAAAGGNEPALLVTGAHHREIAAAGLPGLELLENPAWADGRTGGLSLAAAHLPGRDLLIAPIDVPMVPSEVFVALRAEWHRAQRPPRGWLAPSTGAAPGRPGHPIVVGRELAAKLGGFPPSAPLRNLRDLAQPLWMVDTGCAEIHDDLDTPEDLAALRARLRSRL
ncbi:nucleotidyltransferase family protein [Engelhardtia mirabilis]|uniref:Molybdopterin-guanine dinucleotide biosynthesis protein MobA n=1 Tax=Engelhardtia mirabilis TaxID=2528011 RepID=A0A518BK03_9BACT|nr:molybdopterin-guanine dinucleotide biosynthesis protein MobA [Planctomycetes bacterium Pla133]QDV01624.1 molybdopterin-guanine dinucleotide biosynthesis protein MobA [Planctomycetes bacterium Pla86]